MSKEAERDSDETETVAVPVKWNLDGVPTTFANQFLVTVGPPTRSGEMDGVFLVVATVSPPPILGDTPEARRLYMEAAQREGVTADVHGRYYVSRARLEDLIKALESIRDKFDETVSLGLSAGPTSADLK